MNGLIQILNNTGLSRDIAIKAAFYPIACLILIFALLVVLGRNIFHNAVYLALTLMGIACVYLYLDAEFLAIVQILIYVGAIVTLFIFTIMLTTDISMAAFRGMVRRTAISAFASIAIFLMLIKVVSRAAWQGVLPAGPPTSLELLGRSLMSKYALPFEVISLVSLAALVGAIAIGRTDKK